MLNAVILDVIRPRVIMLHFIKLRVTKPSVFILIVILLNVIIPNSIMLTVLLLSAFGLSDILLIVVTLSVIIPSAFTASVSILSIALLKVVAPFENSRKVIHFNRKDLPGPNAKTSDKNL